MFSLRLGFFSPPQWPSTRLWKMSLVLVYKKCSIDHYWDFYLSFHNSSFYVSLLCRSAKRNSWSMLSQLKKHYISLHDKQKKDELDTKDTLLIMYVLKGQTIIFQRIAVFYLGVCRHPSVNHCLIVLEGFVCFRCYAAEWGHPVQVGPGGPDGGGRGPPSCRSTTHSV